MGVPFPKCWFSSQEGVILWPEGWRTDLFKRWAQCTEDDPWHPPLFTFISRWLGYVKAMESTGGITEQTERGSGYQCRLWLHRRWDMGLAWLSGMPVTSSGGWVPWHSCWHPPESAVKVWQMRFIKALAKYSISSVHSSNGLTQSFHSEPFLHSDRTLPQSLTSVTTISCFIFLHSI